MSKARELYKIASSAVSTTDTNTGYTWIGFIVNGAQIDVHKNTGSESDYAVCECPDQIVTDEQLYASIADPYEWEESKVLI